MFEIRPFKAEDLKIISPDIVEGWSEVNETSGPAYTVLLDGKIVMCGGIRIHGIAEAWSAYSKEAKEKHKKSILELSKEYMNKMVNENNIWRLFASAKEKPEFLKYLDFIETSPGMYVNERCVNKNG